MSAPKPGLRDRLTSGDGFVVVTELVPWRGPTADKAGRAGLAAAHALVDDPRRANTFLERDHFAKGAP
jgi:hypothetical protein